MESDPTVRRTRGRPTGAQRAGRRGSGSSSPMTRGGVRGPRAGVEEDDSSQESEEEEDDDVETPLNPSNRKPVVKTQGSSKLWSQNTESMDKERRKRVMSLRPLTAPLTRKKYIFQQEMMRALILLIFAHSILSIQILCVYQNQCFDVSDDPSNWRRWDNGIVPVCLLVALILTPWSLSLISETNLTMLKAGAGMQFVAAIVFNILGGVAYGEWDSLSGIQNLVKDILNQNDYTEPYGDGNRRFPDEAVFFYQLRASGGLDQDEDIKELVQTLVDKMGTLFALNLIGGILFLALFAFSMSYLCHVYYGPKEAAQR
ncbi:hypothetical protein TrCOL_g3896 [Triparma columacea]|uniref:Uncharacterized protein n=1 Tax=Triparma columacea TaxID=722753 RepID=A0A9W7L3D5_9STRA|nr:hypothetical protein TrCOL_g3896 [Triparma columacea]